MDAKISITTACNAKCKTCPVWQYPAKHMDVDKFKLMWTKLMLAPKVRKVLLNNTGDMYLHPRRKEIFEYIETHKCKAVIMTTNAGQMDYIPDIDHIVISFNGGDKKSYEYTTGLDFDKTVARIKSHYNKLKDMSCEINCLIWDGNEGSEDALVELWKDFPGSVRVSYKYDNQMKEDHTVDKYKREKRRYCDYLDMLSIMPDGKIISCAHDFESVTNYGNIFMDSMDDIFNNPVRVAKQAEHRKGLYTGLCEKCNYNTGDAGRVFYIK